jgi:hypothetical protein
MLLFCAAVARAETAGPYRVRYEPAPDLGCPDESAFTGQVEARTRRVAWARAREPATVLEVVISSVPGGAAGVLTVRTPDGSTSEREVTAASCEQVLSALALVTALALDPDASTAPIAPVVPPPASAPTAPAAPPAAPEVPWVWQIGVSAELFTAFAPDPAFWVRPHVELARGDVAARLSAGWARATARSAEGAAALTLVAGRVELCPVRLDLGPTVLLTPCGALDAGVLGARGVDVTPSADTTRPWLTAGVSTRLSAMPFAPVVIEVGGELFATLVRDRFYVQEDTTLHKTPAVGGALGIGLGVHSP